MEGKREGSTMEERPSWSWHAQEDFGRASAGQTWKVRDKEMQEEKEVHERKGQRDVKLRKYAGGETWSGHGQQEFGRGNAGQNGKYGEIKRNTRKTTIFREKIGRRAKAHKG